MFFHTKSQIIDEFRIDGLNVDSLQNILGNFLYKNCDAGSIDATIFFRDKENCYLIDTIYNNGFTQEKMILDFYTLLTPRYIHILLYYDTTMYIINMRNSLDNILNQINAISVFSKEFINDCCEKVKKTHRHNWEVNNTIPQYYLDNEGVLQPKVYDPKK